MDNNSSHEELVRRARHMARMCRSHADLLEKMAQGVEDGNLDLLDELTLQTEETEAFDTK